MPATVKPRGDIAEFRRVFGDIGIQQDQGDTAHFQIPNPGVQLAFREHQADFYQLPRRRAGPFHGQVLDFPVWVQLLLPSIVVQALLEITLEIEKSDRHQRHRQI